MDLIFYVDLNAMLMATCISDNIGATCTSDNIRVIMVILKF